MSMLKNEERMLDLSALNFEKGGGLVIVVAVDAATGTVLMVAHADREAIEKSMSSGEMHYHSRTRGLWRKGETSGNTQRVLSLSADCDGDAVLARVESRGPACHTGSFSCFSNAPVGDVLSALDATIEARARHVEPDSGNARKPSYTQRLLADRNLRLKKLGEESAELICACADASRERAIEEAADLVYHAAVALHAVGATISDVRRVLADRSSDRTPR